METKSTSLKICFYFFILVGLYSAAQNETKKWFFGQNAGLDFMFNPPAILSGGMMNTSEGCASVANAAGSLLFYTDGVSIWNQTHAVMANGAGLTGNASTTQSGLIVKQPGNSNIYFVFTLGASCTGTLCYSTVDMNLAAGLGSVTIKNTSVVANCAEKLTSVRHCNGTDIWVLSHDGNSNNFRSFLVNATGVNTTAVVSAIGSVSNAACYGQMKISPNGKKLATVLPFLFSYDLFDFDNSTGIVSNYQPLNSGAISQTYGCDFSSDGSKFYGGCVQGGAIYQWDLCAGSASAIAASRYTVTTGPAIKGSLQLGPDGKIYVARTGTSILGVINLPNIMGAGCNYVDGGQNIAPATSQFGLPNFITSQFKPLPPPFTYTLSCQTSSFSGTAPLSGTCAATSFTLVSSQWNFGDPASGTANTSTLTNPVHVYPAAGTYTALLVLTYNCSADTIKQVVNVLGSAPNLSVTLPATLCTGKTATLQVSGGSTYSWTTPSGSVISNSSIAVSPTVTSIYTVNGTGTVAGCFASKTVTLNISKCIGIDELDIERAVQIFPNPSAGLLFIENLATKVKITLLDQLGSIVYENVFDTGIHKVDVSKLSSGVYFVKANTDSQMKTSKLVKTD